jgi:kynureninase
MGRGDYQYPIPIKMENFKQEAKILDSKDPLSKFKELFIRPENLIYLDGNSLGMLPKKTSDLSRQIVDHQWGNRLIRGWNEHWLDLSGRIAKKIAALTGALEEEIFVGDSTSLNLYKLLFAALKYRERFYEIVSDDLNFPTDLYVIQGLIKHQFKKHRLLLMKSENGISMSKDRWKEHINAKTAVVSLSHVTYRSSFMYPMQELTEWAHDKGSLVLWDLSHAVGAVELELNKWKVDLAVGCTYKYLNGGPGAPAFLYVSKDLQKKLSNPVSSWFGHQKPFDFDLNYKAADSIDRFAIGTPSILSLAAVEPGLDIILDAGIKNIRKKSGQQTAYLFRMIEKELLPLGFHMASPKIIVDRGAHISIQHEEAFRINRALIEPEKGEKSIIPDFRPPNIIRLGIAPLYISFGDLFETVIRLKEIINNKEYRRFSQKRPVVT